MAKPINTSPGILPLFLVVIGLLTGATATRIVPGGTAETTSAQTSTTGEARSTVRSPSALSQAIDSADHLLQNVLGRPEAPSVAPIDLLIATLPDYVDSNTAWLFDPGLDAIQRAAGAAGYALYRFYLPDWPPDTAGDEDRSSIRPRHEIEPGLALFRHDEVSRDNQDSTKVTTRLLGVLIVTETPTSGIHQDAFAEAARLVQIYSAPAYTLKILGPHFSGASPSLRQALDDFLSSTSKPPAAVRILSGTATLPANRDLLTWKERPWIRFGTTVQDDNVMLGALHKHIRGINPEWGCGAGVALLVESNTGYGQ